MRSPPGPGGEEGSLAPSALGWEEKGGGLEGRSMAESSRLASQLTQWASVSSSGNGLV